jgi:hypothetical protein
MPIMGCKKILTPLDTCLAAWKVLTKDQLWPAAQTRFSAAYARKEVFQQLRYTQITI